MKARFRDLGLHITRYRPRFHLQELGRTAEALADGLRPVNDYAFLPLDERRTVDPRE